MPVGVWQVAFLAKLPDELKAFWQKALYTSACGFSIEESEILKTSEYERI